MTSALIEGIAKAGNKRARWIMVELGWSWLRYQLESDLSQWFNQRFAHGGKRMRRIGIVALARRLAIALWRYLEHGVIPAGATLKPIPLVVSSQWHRDGGEGMATNVQ